MWEIKISEKAENELIKQRKLGKISAEDLRIIKMWIDQIEVNGPRHVQEEEKWDDHALHGFWEGFRSSCFSKSGRIIYRIIKEKIIVEVVRITPDHNYRSLL